MISGDNDGKDVYNRHMWLTLTLSQVLEKGCTEHTFMSYF